MPFIVAAIAIASAVASASAQSKDAVRNINSLNTQNAVQAREIADEKSLQIEQAAEQGRRQRALVSVAAGEAGLSTTSNSVEAQFNDSFLKQDQTEALVIKSNTEAQANRQAQAQSAYNQLLPPPGWATDLGIVDSGVSAYAGAGGKFGSSPAP